MLNFLCTIEQSSWMCFFFFRKLCMNNLNVVCYNHIEKNSCIQCTLLPKQYDGICINSAKMQGLLIQWRICCFLLQWKNPLNMNSLSQWIHSSLRPKEKVHKRPLRIGWYASEITKDVFSKLCGHVYFVVFTNLYFIWYLKLITLFVIIWLK